MRVHVAIFFLLAGCCHGGSTSPEPSIVVPAGSSADEAESTSTPEPEPTPTLTPIPAPSPEPTVTSSPTPEPTDVPVSTPTPAPDPTPEPTPDPTPEPEPTPPLNPPGCVRYYSYPDADGDGWGSSVGAVYECVRRDGYVGNNTDCDDASAAVNPGASEVPGNGIDDNCDGWMS